MEGLFVVLLIIFLISSSRKKNKKRTDSAPSNTAPGARSQVPQSVARPQAPQPDPTPVSRLSPAERSARIEELKGRKQARQAAAQIGKAAAGLPGSAARMVSVYTQLRGAMEAAFEPAPVPQTLQAPAAPLGEGLSRPGSLSASAQGQSAFDDEGCVGGSLPHDHSEGESRSEHAQHIAAMKARDAEETAIAAPQGLAGLDPRDLRRAVVISEILGKPKALKRKAG